MCVCLCVCVCLYVCVCVSVCMLASVRACARVRVFLESVTQTVHSFVNIPRRVATFYFGLQLVCPSSHTDNSSTGRRGPVLKATAPTADQHTHVSITLTHVRPCEDGNLSHSNHFTKNSHASTMHTSDRAYRHMHRHHCRIQESRQVLK